MAHLVSSICDSALVGIQRFPGHRSTLQGIMGVEVQPVAKQAHIAMPGMLVPQNKIMHLKCERVALIRFGQTFRTI